MKRHIPVFICCMFIQKIYAQGHLREAAFKNDISLSFSTMYSTVDFTIDDYKMLGEPYIGYGLNLFYNSNFNRYLSVKTGIMYHSFFNYIQTPEREEYKIHLDNIHIPLLFALNTDQNKIINYSLFAGPQICFNLNSSYDAVKIFDLSTITTRRLPKSDLIINKIDYGLAYGGGADICLSPINNIRLTLGYMGTFGLAAVNGSGGETERSLLPERTTKKTFGGYAGLSCTF